MYKVYMWINKANGKRYIGQTKQTLKKRAGFEGNGYRGCKAFFNAIQKYGFNMFESVILADGLELDAANQLEMFYIEKYKTRDHRYGYNIEAGGGNLAEAFHQKASTTLKEQRSTPEYRAIMSARMKQLWDDPNRRADYMAKRAGKYQGRHPVALFCEETGEVYPDLHKAAAALGVSVSGISLALSKQGDTAIIGKRKNSPIYTIHKIKDTHKDSNLQ